MTDLILYYIIPNIALFGGIYLLAKAIENTTWNFIVWYCDNY
jgi:hypothetical protein